MKNNWFWQNKVMDRFETALLNFTTWFWNKRRPAQVTTTTSRAKKAAAPTTEAQVAPAKKAPAKRTAAKKAAPKATGWSIK